MEIKIYKINGEWIIENEKGQVFQVEKNSHLDDMNIIDLATTLTSFSGIKVNVDWTNR